MPSKGDSERHLFPKTLKYVFFDGYGESKNIERLNVRTFVC